MNLGDTYRLMIGAHLRVVISDPTLDAEKLVVVSLTSHLPWQDQSCVLFPGEHPFIRKKTVIYYALARFESNRNLERQLSTGEIQLHQPVTPQVLQKILAGAKKSVDLEAQYRQHLQS